MRLAQWWIKLYPARKWTTGTCCQQLLLAVSKFYIAIEEQGYCGLMHANPCHPMLWRQKHNCSYVRELSDNTNCETKSHSSHHTRILHGGWLHRGPCKTTKPSKLGGGTCTKMGICSLQFDTTSLIVQAQWYCISFVDSTYEDHSCSPGPVCVVIPETVTS